MAVLINNTVKTATADYPCKTREEAEALLMAIQARERREGLEAAREPQAPDDGVTRTPPQRSRRSRSR